VLGVLAIDACLQLAPVIPARVAQVDLGTGVVGHVHALVGIALIGNVLIAELQVDQMVVVSQRKAERLVGGFVS